MPLLFPSGHTATAFTETEITLPSPSFQDRAQDKQEFRVGTNEILDVINSAASPREDLKQWLIRHPGLTINEALRRYRNKQKAKQRRSGSKRH